MFFSCLVGRTVFGCSSPFLAHVRRKYCFLVTWLFRLWSAYPLQRKTSRRHLSIALRAPLDIYVVSLPRSLCIKTGSSSVGESAKINKKREWRKPFRIVCVCVCCVLTPPGRESFRARSTMIASLFPLDEVGLPPGPAKKRKRGVVGYLFSFELSVDAGHC